VLTAGGRDVAAADDALTVDEENDLAQHGERVGSSAGGVVLLIRQLTIVNFFRVVPAQAGTQWLSLINNKRH
jgi:hypothetical protein